MSGELHEQEISSTSFHYGSTFTLMPSTKFTNTPERRCQLKISLDGIRPMIWRRIVVPHTISLEGLQNVFQNALGWTNSHLHMFEAYGIECRFPYDDPDGLQENEVDEDGMTLDLMFHKSKDQFKYIYDYGDHWEHTVVVERMLPFWKVPNAPLCLDGANAVPPEDCGSVPGYRDLRKILKNPKHKEYAEMRRWAGRKFDPLAFDIATVNKRLEMYRKKGRLKDSMLSDIRMS